ncbi:unnamed protein product [Prorocentrum cordatum]|uniref:Uncharacterized protein n=1 Tax=Prorocentrum cordatum TaxID=2364126 RepID=A0ABN9V186_9DINO|nr:unnamed protein product [Polarella glacialis]
MSARRAPGPAQDLERSAPPKVMKRIVSPSSDAWRSIPGHGGAIALEQDRETHSSGDLRVGEARRQRREGALAVSIPAAGHGGAIAPEQDRFASLQRRPACR